MAQWFLKKTKLLKEMQKDPLKIWNTLLHTCPLTSAIIRVQTTAVTNPVVQDAPELSYIWVLKSQ